MLPPETRIDEDEFFRWLPTVIVGVTALTLVPVGLYYLACWVATWDAHRWQQLAALVVSMAGLLALGFGLERLEAAGERRRARARCLTFGVRR